MRVCIVRSKQPGGLHCCECPEGCVAFGATAPQDDCGGGWQAGEAAQEQFRGRLWALSASIALPAAGESGRRNSISQMATCLFVEQCTPWPVSQLSQSPACSAFCVESDHFVVHQ